MKAHYFLCCSLTRDEVVAFYLSLEGTEDAPAHKVKQALIALLQAAQVDPAVYLQDAGGEKNANP